MKKITLKKLSIFSIGILFVFAVNACKKTDSESSIAYIRVVNASPTAATYNVYLNGGMINSAALPYAGGTAYGAQTAGTYALKFTTASSSESLLSKNIAVAASSYNSFYLFYNNGTLDGLSTADDMSLPATDKAYIRFIHLSPDASALDLVKNGASTNYFTNKAFKSISGFTTVDAGTVAYDVKETSSGTTKASISGVTLTAGYHYDVICGGLVNPVDDTQKPVNLQVIQIK